MLVLTGGMASGKTTTAKILEEEYGFSRIISYTTRPMRDSEVNYDDYVFETEEEWKLHQYEPNNFLVETSFNTVFGVWRYGTLLDDIRKADDETVFVANNYEVARMQDLGIDAVFIQLCVSEDELFRRIGKRGDNEKEVRRRITDENLKYTGLDTIKFEIDKMTPEEVAKRISLIYEEELV